MSNSSSPVLTSHNSAYSEEPKPAMKIEHGENTDLKEMTSGLHSDNVSYSDKNTEYSHKEINLPSIAHHTPYPQVHFGPVKSELIVRNLLITSDSFLDLAHQSVLECNNEEGRNSYFKMIKISIKCLLILVKKYEQCLSPQLESTICFKLAKIYFTETDNINRADHYVNLAISIAGRNRLYDIKFISEFLAAQIIEKTNSKLSLNYLNDKIDFYRKLELNYFSNLFKFLKFNNLLLMDHDTGLVVLQNLCFDDEIDSITRSLCLMYQSGLHSYRGSPSQSLSLLEETEKILLTVESHYPVQLEIMMNILKYFALLQMNKIDDAKAYMSRLGALIQIEQRNHWHSWKESGSFNVEVFVDKDDNSRSISYEVNWLNSDEFIILFYFITGISLLAESHNGKNKAKKVFDKCIQIITKQLDELTHKVEAKRSFPLNQLTNKIIMLNYLKYNINYYQVWMRFIGQDYSDMSYLNDFMNNYNSRKFTSEEFAYYKLLIPKIFYLFGIYYHHQGDVSAARFYFMKVRNYSANPRRSVDKRIPILQVTLGIGCELFQAENEFSELFVLSSLHLLILVEHELERLSANRKSNEDINEYHKLSTVLYGDLNRIFTYRGKQNSNSFKNGFVDSNELLIMSYELLNCVYNGPEKTKFDDLVKHSISLNSNTSFPFVYLLLNYMLFQNTSTLKKRDEYFSLCLQLTGEPRSHNEKVISILVLKELVRKCSEAGDSEQANIIHLRLKALQDGLKNKVELAFYAERL